jgi:type IV secretory pathway VirB3-like protein
MINYQGGFVRRGLIGEVLFFLHQHCGINVYWTAKIASLIFYSIVCGFFVIAFRKKGYALYLIPLCFFCGALIGWGYWIRKDALMLCILIATLLIWNSNRRSFSPILRIIAINLLSVFILLVHECFAFFALPLLFLLIFHHYRNKGFWRSGFLSSLSLLPALGAFLLLLWKHGDAETALTIWNSWQTTLSNEVPAGAIQAIGWTTKDAIAFHIEQNFLGSTHEGFSVFHWVTIFPAIYYVLINTLAVFKKQPETYTENHRAILSLILLFQFVCMIPLFTILACDYDRSFFYLTASSFALFLIIPMKTLEGLFPPIVYGLANKINKGLDNLLLPSKTMVVFLMLIINVPPQANSILSQLCLSFSEIFLFAGSFIRTIFGS